MAKMNVDKLVQETVAAYDNAADKYEEFTIHLGGQDDLLAYFMELVPKGKILDVGCGPGVDAEIFKTADYDVTAIDLNDRFVQLVRRRVPNIKVLKMDMREITWRNEFDGIWASASLLHLPKSNFENVLRRLVEALKSDGCIFLALKQGEGKGWKNSDRFGTDRKYFAFYQIEELENIFKKLGVSVVKLHYNDTKVVKWMNIYLKTVNNL